MSGVGAQVLSHLVRRGLEQYPNVYDVSPITPLPAHATALPQPGQVKEVNFEISPAVIVGAVIIGAICLLLVASVDYTVGSVMSSLAMIESPSSTTIIESQPPAYSEEPDAPLEKKELLEDVELVVINHKPITSSIVATIKHLHRTGGFFARWRGLFQSIIYHMATNFTGHLFGGLFSIVFGRMIGQALGFTFSIIAMCRLHMLWTHAMIAMPTNTPWYKRFATRKDAKALLLPSLVYAVTQQLVIAAPVAVYFFIYFSGALGLHQSVAAGNKIAMVFAGLEMLMIPISAILVALYAFLPAATTLIRIEACLLPEDQETIVPFDRQAIKGEIDLAQRGGAKQLYVAARKSFTPDVRGRLVKLAVKLFAFQFTVIFLGLQLIGGLLWLTSKDQIINTIQHFQAGGW